MGKPRDRSKKTKSKSRVSTTDTSSEEEVWVEKESNENKSKEKPREEPPESDDWLSDADKMFATITREKPNSKEKNKPEKPSIYETSEEAESSSSDSVKSSIVSSAPSTSSSKSLRGKRKQPMENDMATEVLHLAEERLNSIQPEDRFDVFGKHVAYNLRGVDPNQLIFAQKLINDVIFMAQLGSLSEDIKCIKKNGNNETSPSTNNSYEIPPCTSSAREKCYREFLKLQVEGYQQRNSK